MAKTDISVIIALEDRTEALPTLLSCLEKQRFPAARYEVLLVFYSSISERTLAMVEHHTAGAPMAVRTFHEPSGSEILAKNLGANNAASNLLLFLDQDLLAGSRLLSEHADLHSTFGPRTIVMGSVAKSKSLPQSALTRWFMKHDTDLMSAEKPDSPLFWSSRHCSLNRTCFILEEGFEEKYLAVRAVEIAFAQRMIENGYTMKTMGTPHAFIWREAHFDDERIRFRQEGYGLGQMSMTTKISDILHHFRLRCSRLSFQIDALFTPFYVRTCQEAELDIRIHAPICQRIFAHDLRCGARAALDGKPNPGPPL